jgi:hypothetical protein
MEKQGSSDAQKIEDAQKKVVLKQRIPIGHNVYLFKDMNGWAHMLPKECLISARSSIIDPEVYKAEVKMHKNYDGAKPTFRLPQNVTLKFYNDPGREPADGASVRKFHNHTINKGVATAFYGGAPNCPNFILKKYQVTIQDTKPSRIYPASENPYNLPVEVYRNETYGILEHYPYDIITVRNRFMDDTICLEDLISSVEKMGLHFNIYHCLFSPF